MPDSLFAVYMSMHVLIILINISNFMLKECWTWNFHILSSIYDFESCSVAFIACCVFYDKGKYDNKEISEMDRESQVLLRH